MTDGRGYIALAAMIFGKWTPIGAFIACLIFGFGQAVYDANSSIRISQYLLSMTPYLLTLIVLAAVLAGFVVWRARPHAGITAHLPLDQPVWSGEVLRLHLEVVERQLHRRRPDFRGGQRAQRRRPVPDPLLPPARPGGGLRSRRGVLQPGL